MSTPLKVGAFLLGLLVVFTVAFAVGHAVGPVGVNTTTTRSPAGQHMHGG